MAGNEELIALISSLDVTEVARIKRLDGGWFDNMIALRTKKLSREQPKPGPLNFRGGFKPAEDRGYEGAHWQASCQRYKMPLCTW
jgi:hypothetical protein